MVPTLSSPAQQIHTKPSGRTRHPPSTTAQSHPAPRTGLRSGRSRGSAVCPGLCAVLGLPTNTSLGAQGWSRFVPQPHAGVPDPLPWWVSPSPTAPKTPGDGRWPSPPGHFQLSQPCHQLHPFQLRWVRFCPSHSQFFPQNFQQIHATLAKTGCCGMAADGQRTDPGTRLHLSPSHAPAPSLGSDGALPLVSHVPIMSPPCWQAHRDT